MQLITAFRNGKMYASTQEPAVSHLFHPKQNKTERNKKKLRTVPDREEVQHENTLSSIHDFLCTPGVVQPP